MSTADSVNAIINSGRTEANKLVTKAISMADAAQTAASSVLTSIGTIPTPVAPSIDPIPYKPSSDLSADFTTAFDSAKTAFGAEFGTAFDAFITRFFPKIEECMRTSIDDWICNTINNGGTGIPAGVEAAIWQRSRDRESQEATRQKSELTKGWAARGFSLPPGVLLEGLQSIDQDLANKTSSHGRDIAIKNIEIEIENIRFAITNGIQLRLGAIASVLDYLRAYMTPWQLAEQKAAAIVAAKEALWGASSSYYNALINAESLEQRYQELRVSRGEREVTLNLQGFIATVENRVKAAVSSAEALASAASSALSAQVSLGQLAYQQIEEA